MSTSIIPSGLEDYIELGASTTGKLFRKHLLTVGPLRHPNTKRSVDITENTLDTLVTNFQNRTVGIVHVPLADAQNRHNDDPSRNIGEIVGVEKRDGKLYGIVDVRDPEAQGKMGKTLLGASALIDMNYSDRATGEQVGPALLHMCVTNRPHLTDLEDYEEMVSLTADSVEDVEVLLPVDLEQEIVAIELEEPQMNKDEMVEALKADHDIDVVSLQASAASAAEADERVSLSSVLGSMLVESNLIELSQTATEATDEQIVASIGKLADDLLGMTNKLAETEAAVKVDALVEEGRILPAQRDSYISLSQQNPELFDQMVPENAIVTLSQEVGTDASESDRINAADAQSSAIEEYANLSTDAGYIR